MCIQLDEHPNQKNLSDTCKKNHRFPELGIHTTCKVVKRSIFLSVFEQPSGTQWHLICSTAFEHACKS